MLEQSVSEEPKSFFYNWVFDADNPLHPAVGQIYKCTYKSLSSPLILFPTQRGL